MWNLKEKINHCFLFVAESTKGRYKLKNSGETITEVMVSTVILVTILVASFTILKNAVETNMDVRNRIIALNIAREGVEGVRNIRDTNWLKYSGDRREKWLCYDTLDALNNCDSVPMTPDLNLANGFYTVDFSGEHSRYFLKEIAGAEVLNIRSNSNGLNEFRLYTSRQEGSEGRFVHSGSENNLSTPFYRQIELAIENPYGENPPGFCNIDPCNSARLHIVSRVQWKEEKNMRTVTLEGYLFDFFEREKY